MCEFYKNTISSLATSEDEDIKLLLLMSTPVKRLGLKLKWWNIKRAKKHKPSAKQQQSYSNI